jgi:hypothetical protein
MTATTAIAATGTSNQLNDRWVLWYHSCILEDWSIGGYQKIMETDSISDFWIPMKAIKDFTQGMYFLMRNNNLPIWEYYTGAGSKIILVKYKTTKKDYHPMWQNLCVATVAEALGKDSNKIVGVSISPKHKSIIITIWIVGSTTCPDLGPHLPFDIKQCITKQDSEIVR